MKRLVYAGNIVTALRNYLSFHFLNHSTKFWKQQLPSILNSIKGDGDVGTEIFRRAIYWNKGVIYDGMRMNKSVWVFDRVQERFRIKDDV